MFPIKGARRKRSPWSKEVRSYLYSKCARLIALFLELFHISKMFTGMNRCLWVFMAVNGCFQVFTGHCDIDSQFNMLNMTR